jgi:hypothetical protein
MLTEYGWIISDKKSNMIPTKTFEYLGWIWSSEDQTLELTPDRRRGMIKQLKRLIRIARNNQFLRTRVLAKRIGELIFARS